MSRSDPSKPELRGIMRRRLSKIERGAAEGGAEAIATRAMALPRMSEASVVLSCLSFGDELDTRPLIERLLASGRRVCVPRCVEGTRNLTLHAYPCSLERLSFGLQQPTIDSPRTATTDVDLALLVGLAFDSRGYRLGYGGGYFDRLLTSHPIPALGLAYDLQIVDRLPSARHDVAMTAVITETRHLQPAPSAG